MNKYKIIRTKNIKFILGIKIHSDTYQFIFSPIYINSYIITINKNTKKHIYIGISLIKIDLYLDMSWNGQK